MSRRLASSGAPVRNSPSPLRALAGGLALSLLLAAAPAGAQDTSPSGTGGVTGEQIKQVLGLDGKDAKALGTGLHFKLGIVLALTGPGSYYGRIQGSGAKLAVAQIKAAGGPDIELIFKDHKTADAQAGARATRELGIDGVPAILSSFVGDIGAMFPGVAQYKMLTLDGGGGTSDFGQRKPFFWGMRAIEPDDDFIGALKYWKATDPKVKRVSLVYFDQGPANEIVINNFKKALAETGHGTRQHRTDDHRPDRLLGDDFASESQQSGRDLSLRHRRRSRLLHEATRQCRPEDAGDRRRIHLRCGQGRRPGLRQLHVCDRLVQSGKADQRLVEAVPAKLHQGVQPRARDQRRQLL